MRGPYLQNATPTSVLVKWRTDLPADSFVRFGPSPENLHRIAGDSTPETEHSIPLAGLEPSTRYYYSIGTSNEVFASGPDHYFHTSPLPGTRRPVRIWAIGDCGTASVGYPGSRLVRDAYYSFAETNHTDVWLMLGDNAYFSGTDSEYQLAVFDVYQQMLRNTILWSTIGNHETYGPDEHGQIAYHGIFSLPQNGQAGGIASGTENYYSFDFANIHFVCLDSEYSIYDPTLRETMLRWLEQDLAANTNEWVIAFWHSPPYTKGSHNSDSFFDSAGRLFMMRTNVVPVLESYGVDLVLCGHSHNYERSYPIYGHYDVSRTFTPEMAKDAGSGRLDDTGAYLRTAVGSPQDHGIVYVVAGSSGWATGLQPDGPHPVMYITVLRMGSMVIDVNGSRLDAKFLRETGEIDDYFTIIKNAEPEPLRIARLQLDDDQVILRWKSEAGQNYQVESAITLEPQKWNPVGESILAYGPTTSWTNLISDPAATFYRIVQLP